MAFREFLQGYLSFSRRDRAGLLLLFFLIAVIYCLPRFFSKGPEPPLEDKALSAAVDSLLLREQNEPPRSYQKQKSQAFTKEAAREGQLFPFDPNTLSREGWQRLGLSSKTAATIEKYRIKGGRFRRPEDLQKIWGLPQGFYERVQPYISIKGAAVERVSEVHKPPFYPQKPEPEILGINSADSAEWERLPGISARLAGRICTFRNKLGGFYSVDQVSETYGLPDSIFQLLKDRLKQDGVVRKISINTVSREVLGAHPYFRWKLANAIVAYRSQHGNFKGPDDLKAVAILDEATLQKILPYISWD